MAKKSKPVVNKEYEWELDVEGELRSFKVFVGEDECVTYADGVECARMPIVDQRQEKGVLQIDCMTQVFDEEVPFQLEKGVPYIKIFSEDKIKWIVSDTTREERFQAEVLAMKKRCYGMFASGLILTVWAIVQMVTVGSWGDFATVPMMAAFCYSIGALYMVQLRNQLLEAGRKFSFKLSVKA